MLSRASGDDSASSSGDSAAAELKETAAMDELIDVLLAGRSQQEVTRRLLPTRTMLHMHTYAHTHTHTHTPTHTHARTHTHTHLRLGEPAYVAVFMPPLCTRLTSLAQHDRDLIPLLECLTTVRACVCVCVCVCLHARVCVCVDRKSVV